MNELWDWVLRVFTREITIFGKRIKDAKTGPQPFMCRGKVPDDVRDAFIAYLGAGEQDSAKNYLHKVQKELEEQTGGKVYLNHDIIKNEIDILMLSPLYGSREEGSDVRD